MPSRTQNCSTIIFLFFSYLFSSICKTDWLFDWLTDWKSGAGKPSRHVTSHPGKLSLAIPPWCSWCLAQGKRIADQRCAFLLLIWDRLSERQTDKRTERQRDIITISYRVAQKTGPTYLIAYGLRVLRAHGMSDDCIHEVFRSTVLAKLVYASPAWSGYCSESDVSKIDRYLNRCKRLNYCYCLMLKSICTVWINDSSCVFARRRHSAMKFLNKKLMTVFSI